MVFFLKIKCTSSSHHISVSPCSLQSGNVVMQEQGALFSRLFFPQWEARICCISGRSYHFEIAAEGLVRFQLRNRTPSRIGNRHRTGEGAVGVVAE
jgi:hypothetical protein